MCPQLQTDGRAFFFRGCASQWKRNCNPAGVCAEESGTLLKADDFHALLTLRKPPTQAFLKHLRGKLTFAAFACYIRSHNRGRRPQAWVPRGSIELAKCAMFRIKQNQEPYDREKRRCLLARFFSEGGGTSLHRLEPWQMHNAQRHKLAREPANLRGSPVPAFR